MKRAILILAAMTVPMVASAQQTSMLLDLSGKWKFRIGDDMNRAAKTFDDSKWDPIYVPSPWEDQGFPGYDGYGWYRKSFHADNDWSERRLYLSLGTVDDVDEVYLNGHMMGFSGEFPPHYMTSYSDRRMYHIPPEFLNAGGENIIAVRVYDGEFSGGITSGRIGIFEDKDPLVVDFPLTTGWKFTTGDYMACKDASFNDSRWQEVIVPLYWEVQGHIGYDGFGWYRLRFTPPSWMADQTLILIAGKIDDFDETYLNGERIGRTGSMTTLWTGSPPQTGDYLKLRAYTIPANLLHPGEENLLAIRVYDGFMHGGIYDGPIGIVTREKYMRWENRHGGKKNPVERFMDWLFN